MLIKFFSKKQSTTYIYIYTQTFLFFFNQNPSNISVSWVLLNTSTASLQRGKIPPMSVLDMTWNHVMSRPLALEIWGMLTGPLWSRVAAPDRALSMSQIEETMYSNKWLMFKLWLLHSNIQNHVTVCKKEAQVHLRMLSTKLHIFNIIRIKSIWN